MTRPVGTVSVDLDPVDLHLLGYGVRSLPPDPLVYTTAVPRLLEAFGRCGVRATFFVVARDAAAQGSVLAAIAGAGHEVASHSLRHPLALSRLPTAELLRELMESRERLEKAVGAPVVGFRSPNFDMDERALGLLAEAGYAYDASAYPSPMLAPARLVLALQSRDPLGVLTLRAWPFTWRRDPHMRRAGTRTVHEFPVSVTPRARWPVYHTLRYAMGDARFERILDGFVRRGETLSYPLHAVDALGLEEDGVDGRLARHPGLRLPLAAKLALLGRTLEAIVARFDPQPFRARLAPA